MEDILCLLVGVTDLALALFSLHFVPHYVHSDALSQPMTERFLGVLVDVELLLTLHPSPTKHFHLLSHFSQHKLNLTLPKCSLLVSKQNCLFDNGIGQTSLLLLFIFKACLLHAVVH